LDKMPALVVEPRFQVLELRFEVGQLGVPHCELRVDVVEGGLECWYCCHGRAD